MDDQRPTCPGGCGQTVNHPACPCDRCWDRLPTNLKRGLLLSLASAAPITAVLAAEAYYRDHPPIHTRADQVTTTPGPLHSQPQTTVGEHP